MGVGTIATAADITKGVNTHVCPDANCDIVLVDGTGAACEEHQAWFDDQVAAANAGIPSDCEDSILP